MSLFTKGPSIPPPPPDTTAEDAAKAAEAKRKLRAEMAARRGRTASILTSGLGATDDAQVKRPTLG